MRPVLVASLSLLGAALVGAVPHQRPHQVARDVPGKAFDRMVIIWLENTDYDKAKGDPSLSALAKKGIALSGYHGLSHPSAPNYIAAVGGDYFGLDHDGVVDINENVATVVDLLEDKGISWAEYQENMPYDGFLGEKYVNQQNGANDYVRKHNPLIYYESVSKNPGRLAKTKTFVSFYKDLADDKLPQWMFITPNMTNDGHDTSVTFAGKWAKSFIEPLMQDPKFMKRTLVLLTFDENHNYFTHNRVMGILLGDVVPKELHGTEDKNYYNHYSSIATVEANWGLHTLGRFDVGANVFKFVADKVNEKVRVWSGKPKLEDVRFNAPYPGHLSLIRKTPIPAPNVRLQCNQRTVLPKIVQAWQNSKEKTYYTDALEVPDGFHPPKDQQSWWFW